MLTRQQCGRCHHRHLNPRHGRNKRGAHRNLGFAKSDITTNQSIHRLAAGQIIHHIADCAQLIIGFLIGKAGAERLPHARWRIEYRRFAQRAFGRHPNQPVSHVTNTLFQAGFFGLPRTAAQPIKQALIMAVF